MDRSTRDAVLRATTVAAFVAGVALVVVGGTALNTAGLLLVILSAVLFLPTVRDFIVREEKAERDDR